MNTLIELLERSLTKYNLVELSKKLNVDVNTINRWISLDKIPDAYEFELMKINDIHIDYSKYEFKRKDQFFTPLNTAKRCYEIFKRIVSLDDEGNYIFVEPSAGNGSFLNVLPMDRTIALDIEPKNENIIEKDFLTWTPSKIEGYKYIVFGNPPFGLRGHMALKFINHSYTFADYVCFILPQLFESDGKGVPRKRVIGFNLIHSETIDNMFSDPFGNKLRVNCVFQIWSKNEKNDSYEIKNINNENMQIFSLSDGGTPATTRNKNMFYECDVYLPSTCFGETNMKYYDSFDSLPGRKGYGIKFQSDKEKCIDDFKRISWCKISFKSTNSAYNIRKSQIVGAYTSFRQYNDSICKTY